jgi:long-chain acyl-CoA synthetase
MLYDRWRAIALERRGDLALDDRVSGRRWTFGQLLIHADVSSDPGATWVCPRGNDANFIFELLRAWRHNRVACPLEANDSPPALPLPLRDIVHVKRTSATTGAARHVAFTAEQLAADPENIVRTMGLRPEWPNLGVISLAHSYGFSNLVLPLLLHGIPLILLNSPLPEALRKYELKDKGLTLAGVPTLWRVWDEADAIPKDVRLAISAGAPLPLSLETKIFEQRGLKIHNFLGASECGGIAYDRTETPRADAAEVGARMKNVAISATDGQLEVRGPAVAQTYWPNAEATLGDRVFRTSDLVEIRDGILYMRGRASDVIHIAGRKVAPEEIERALAKHPAVNECLVFDAPRVGEENQIVAVIVGDTDREALQHFLVEKIPAWQIPRQWRFVGSLGANERGKISRAQWRQKFLNGLPA